MIFNDTGSVTTDARGHGLGGLASRLVDQEFATGGIRTTDQIFCRSGSLIGKNHSASIRGPAD